jgi:hypothetical protein
MPPGGEVLGQEIQGPDGTSAGRTCGLDDWDGVPHLDTIGGIHPGTPPPGFLVTPLRAP